MLERGELPPVGGLVSGFEHIEVAEQQERYVGGRYGLNLLNAELLHGCLLTTERVADAALEGRLPGRNLRKIDLADDYEPRLEIVTGIFARKGERERYADDHPLNLLWNAFTEATPTRPVPSVLPAGV